MTLYIFIYAERLRFGRRWSYFDRLSSTMDFTDYEWCPVCGAPVSRTRHLPPLKIKLSSGNPERWGDFVGGTFFTPLVSDKFRRIYEREKLTGIKFFYPTAEIVRVGNKKTGDFPATLPTYYFIEVAWGGANQDDVTSEVVRRTSLGSDEQEYCTYCRAGASQVISQKGVVIEEGSWIGLDIFELRGGPPYPVVSEKFKEVIKSAHLKNCRFVPSEDFAYDIHNPPGWFERK